MLLKCSRSATEYSHQACTDFLIEHPTLLSCAFPLGPPEFCRLLVVASSLTYKLEVAPMSLTRVTKRHSSFQLRFRFLVSCFLTGDRPSSIHITEPMTLSGAFTPPKPITAKVASPPPRPQPSAPPAVPPYSKYNASSIFGKLATARQSFSSI